MAKICLCEDCDNSVFSNGYCSWHQNLRTDDKWIRSQEKKRLKGRDSQSAKAVKRNSNFIKPVSDKRLGELALYRENRDPYLKENVVCEVRECNNPSTHVHHKNGRIGKMVYNIEYFMAVCDDCHPEKIHFNPGTKWSRPEGYLI
jgi:hypothetical protein